MRMFNTKSTKQLALSILVLLSMKLFAQSGAMPSQTTPTLVNQKLQLVGRLLSESPAAARIHASTNQEAKLSFAQAKQQYESAQKLLLKTEFTQADAALNDAMWLIGKARARVPDSMARVIELRAQANAYRHAVDSMIPAYEAHLARTRELPRDTKPSDDTLSRVRGLLDEARALENAEQIEDANRLLQDAERLMMAGLAKLLKTSTIAYAQKFETQAEEYGFELRRNQSYQELIPLALTELKPAAELLPQIRQYREQNVNAVQLAAKLAEQQRFKDAISALRGGTAYLQGALAVTGLVLPADSVMQ